MKPTVPMRTLPRRVRTAVFLRSLSLQASWNNQRMQNLGLLTTLLPWLRQRPRDLNQDRMFCRRYYEFFNTNPYLANYLIGGLLRLETDRSRGGELAPGLSGIFRDSLGRALASLGDQLFWLGLRPALLMALCLLGLFGQVGAILLVLGAAAVAQLIWRWRALERGYVLGFDLVEVLGRPGWHRAVTAAKRAGMVLTGVVAGWHLTHGWRGTGIVAPRALLIALVLGMVVPLIWRRRWPGEVLVLLALPLGLILSFAISSVWS